MPIANTRPSTLIPASLGEIASGVSITKRDKCPGFCGQLIIVGGTVYNAGARALNTSTSSPPCGLVFNAGAKIHLSNVHIRNNGNGVSTGKGVWCPSSTGVTSLKMIGCQSYDNAAADDLGASTKLMIEDCFFDKTPTMLSLSSNLGIHDVRNNVG